MKTKNLLIKSVIAVMVVLCQLFLQENHLHYLNIGMLLIAFLITLYLHEKFFPLFTISIALFLMASIQEIYDVRYINLPITIFLHIAARMMFAVAIIYELYKTVEDEKL